MKKLLVSSLLAAALPAAALAQGTTLAGWTFSQFLGEGAPGVNAETFETTNFIAATYRGSFNPDSNQVDGVIVGVNGGAGYTNTSFGSWSFANFDFNNAVDVRADTFGALNTQNSTTLDGKQMHLTDGQGMMLSFNVQNTLWSISADTAGYTNVDGADNDFTFAARSTAGATVEWLYNGSVFATTVVAAGSSFNTYGLDFVGDGSGFYGTGVLEGRLVSGVVSFDNAQINGQPSAVPEPSSFAALAGLVGLGFAASRRRRA